MESGREVYDVIVVGAGIEGSSTAYQLAKKGKDVLLLEQFPLPHNRGSSHGQSRITRKAYGNDDFYTEMMKEAFALTDELEAECGQQLFDNCGCLVMGPKNQEFVKETEAALLRYKIPFDKFGTEEQRKRYPNLSYPDNYTNILDKSGGTLRSGKMLEAFQNMFVRNGGILKDGEKMLDISPGDVISVKTDRRTYKCYNVVLTLGPWAAKYLQNIGIDVPLQPLKITVCYWKEKNKGEFDHSIFPTFVDVGGSGTHAVYGLPSYEYPGLVKVCLHHGPNIDPEDRDNVENGWVLDEIKAYVAKHLPSLESEPSIVETCIYTNTKDQNFILDVHPKWKNVVIGAGFSGHGFKLSPVVGKILADLATNQTPSYDLSPFKINRFFKNKL